MEPRVDARDWGRRQAAASPRWSEDKWWRGAALLGTQVYAVNPMASSRYRDRHSVSGAKSDRGDAKVLADLVRTDRHNHRQLAGDSDLAEAVKVLARAHQSAIWSRQRQVNALRSALRDYYPAALAAFGTDLAASDAVAVLALAPTPDAGRALSRSKIASALRRAGRQRNIDRRTGEIQAALRADYLHAPPAIAGAYRAAARSAIRLITAYTAEIAELEQALSEHFEQHPDAKIVIGQLRIRGQVAPSDPPAQRICGFLLRRHLRHRLHLLTPGGDATPQTHRCDPV
jgi:hypothetical protein